MAYAFFDMDGTLIDADSNELFFNYLQEKGIVDHTFIEPLDEFQRLYYEGTLKIDDFIAYAVKPMLQFNKPKRDEIISDFIANKLYKVVKKGAFEALSFHQERGDEIYIVSATVDYIVKGLADALKIPNVIAAPIKVNESGFLENKLLEEVPYQKHKVTRIYKMLGQDLSLLKDSYAYGDSINDKEMLLICEHRIGVDATAGLINADIEDLKLTSWK